MAGRRRRRFSAVSGWIGFLTLDEPAIALLLPFRLRITGIPYAETILSLAFGGWEVTLDELELYDYPFTEDQVSACLPGDAADEVTRHVKSRPARKGLTGRV